MEILSANLENQMNISLVCVELILRIMIIKGLVLYFHGYFLIPYLLSFVGFIVFESDWQIIYFKCHRKHLKNKIKPIKKDNKNRFL